MRFIEKAETVPDEAGCKIEFRSGAISTDPDCGCFFAMLQDKEATLEEAKSYAEIGPMIDSNVDWDEINRILATF